MSSRMDQNYEILERIFALLKETHPYKPSKDEKIVEWKHPEELSKIINFLLLSNKTRSNDDQIVDLCRQVIKYSVKTSHPHFHNQLHAGTSPYALSAAWLTETLNTNCITFEVAPVFILAEKAVIELCVKLFGFAGGDGVMGPGGSMLNMYGMMLARHKMFPEMKRKGIGGVTLVALTSEDCHYSITKGAHVLGIGMDNVVKVKVDERGRMMAAEVEKQIEKCLKEGKVPFFVNATAGTTILGALDDLPGIAKICQKFGLWFHVDACMAGSLIVSKHHKHLLTGIEKADSIAWNAHKTLGVTLQCSIFLTSHETLLAECNSIGATYLFQQDKFYDVSFDLGDKSIQCGRKTDAFHFWLTVKGHGMDELGALMDNAMRRAVYLTKKLKSTPGFRLVLDEFQYTNVCFWYIPERMQGVEENEEFWRTISGVTAGIKEKMVREGTLMVGYQPLESLGLVNFFRMVVTCFPVPSSESMDHVADEIARLGEKA